jgi:hypothetical protein
MTPDPVVEILSVEDTPQDLDLARHALRKAKLTSYIVKPVNFEQFTGAGRKLGMHWLLLNHPPQLEA